MQVADLDHYHNKKPFTIDPTQNWSNLSLYFDQLRTWWGMRTVLVLNSAMISNETDYWPFRTGLERDVFVKWPSSQNPDFDETKSDIMLGYVTK